ncbi:pentapeptide repeat-containing protein [Candidatus Nephthysia bennettiae]|uniref:Pentapeptide repeat-containing protein n=1 Tax=Candidatus Nephthysia bennettiae TaxID=3127016 RepID=A0A934KFJ6_9BACT|nr:pentapeptide repeat-containing protein [Candidatus Dormibacteraeota bacterium]MBJ7612088.1 pentapeptide repeat-containing protein [Candidatus Dormibacteraeota bacterium]
MSEERFESGESYDGFEVRGASLADRLRMLRLSRGRFVDCDLSNAEWERPSLVDVVFERCRMTGFRIVRGRGSGISFDGCLGRYLQMERCEFKDARFTGSQLVEASFVGCQLPGAVMTGCDLTGSVMSSSRFPNADLRGSRLGGLRATWDELAGVILDPEQAMAVLKGHAGITVLPAGVDPDR